MLLCETCGNKHDSRLRNCPYCGAAREGRQSVSAAPLHKTINLEQGMPPANEALQRLKIELEAARLEGCRVLTLIHGYGSSGKGGILRRDIRAQLDYLLYCKKIKLLIPGENFNKHQGITRDFLKRFPALGKHRDLGRGNRGITVVAL